MRALIALLGLALLTANTASAFAFAPVEKPASGSIEAPQQRLGGNSFASPERVRENLRWLYDGASDFPVAAEGGGEGFAYYMNAARTLDVSTAENGAVFYSGAGNRALAEEFALANGRTTTEMTPGGAWLDAQGLFGPASALTRAQALEVWSTLSARFAAGASGNAVGFVEGASSAGIFNTIEFPALLRNPFITNVITGGY